MTTAGELTFDSVNGKLLSVYTTRDDDGVPQGLQISGPLASVTHRGPHADNSFAVVLGFRMDPEQPLVTIEVAPGTPVESTHPLDSGRSSSTTTVSTTGRTS